MIDEISLPNVTRKEFMTILAGLDELPGKYSRVLYDKLVGHVHAQVTSSPTGSGPTRGEVFGYGSPAQPAGSGVVDSMDRGQGAETALGEATGDVFLDVAAAATSRIFGS